MSRVASAAHARPTFAPLLAQEDAAYPLTSDPERFQTLEELRESVQRLEGELAVARPKEPLSGRIIHAVFSLPFLIRPQSEVEFQEKRMERDSATASVAQMAVAARARRAELERLAAEAASLEQQHTLHRHQQSIANKNRTRPSSFVARRSHGAMGMTSMRSDALDAVDLEDLLIQNQERSRRNAGRRAWMMSEAVDDSSELSEEDRFSTISSRRSLASVDIEMPNWAQPHETGLSNQTSPASLSPEPVYPARPPWYLSLHRGHSALNSAIYSLCETFKQTYVGWPMHIQFAEQAEQDERSDVSQTTPAERAEIEEVLASLEDRSQWSLHEGGLAMRPPALEEKGEALHGIRYVPVWLDYQNTHAHYEGYCKSSTSCIFLLTQLFGPCSTTSCGAMTQIGAAGTSIAGTLMLRSIVYFPSVWWLSIVRATLCGFMTTTYYWCRCSCAGQSLMLILGLWCTRRFLAVSFSGVCRSARRSLRACWVQILRASRTSRMSVTLFRAVCAFAVSKCKAARSSRATDV